MTSFCLGQNPKLTINPAPVEMIYRAPPICIDTLERLTKFAEISDQPAVAGFQDSAYSPGQQAQIFNRRMRAVLISPLEIGPDHGGVFRWPGPSAANADRVLAFWIEWQCLLKADFQSPIGSEIVFDAMASPATG